MWVESTDSDFIDNFLMTTKTLISIIYVHEET